MYAKNVYFTVDIYIDINIFNCIVGSMGVVKQQSAISDLKRSFSRIYQIDLSIFVDRSERSERVKKNAAIVTPWWLCYGESGLFHWWTLLTDNLTWLCRPVNTALPLTLAATDCVWCVIVSGALCLCVVCVLSRRDCHHGRCLRTSVRARCYCLIMA